jgi:hypothetical protein
MSSNLQVTQQCPVEYRRKLILYNIISATSPSLKIPSLLKSRRYFVIEGKDNADAKNTTTLSPFEQATIIDNVMLGSTVNNLNYSDM